MKNVKFLSVSLMLLFALSLSASNNIQKKNTEVAQSTVKASPCNGCVEKCDDTKKAACDDVAIKGEKAEKKACCGDAEKKSSEACKDKDTKKCATACDDKAKKACSKDKAK